MLKVNITKLEYNEKWLPPLAVVFECDLFKTEENISGEHTNLFPPEALIDRKIVNDLEHEKAALEFIIKETIQRSFPANLEDIEFVWASDIDTKLLTKYLPNIEQTTPQDFSYLYSG